MKKSTRRKFIKNSSSAFVMASFYPPTISRFTMETRSNSTMKNSIIGHYGDWAAGLAADPPLLSFRRPEFDNIDTWRKAAWANTNECLSAPDWSGEVKPQVIDETIHAGVKIETWEWQLPYGGKTSALFLKPTNQQGPLPAVLGLHDHGGNKYLGWRKIADRGDVKPDFIKDHRDTYYGGVAWANELAKRGYAVLVHDTFTFGSRRVFLDQVNGIEWGMPEVPPPPVDGEDIDYINAYNHWASEHEHVLSKSLFCAGTTWPGVFLREDQAALGILADHPAVDADRLGCCGLSGGGLRSVYLGGMDDRIKCAVPVGFMSTWRDFILHKSFTHTWMLYAPLLPKYLDFPEILGMRAPLPTMVLNCKEDPLYTLPEMQRADEILTAVFKKADAAENFKCNFYSGGHKFDLEMQADAFEWFDRWLT